MSEPYSFVLRAKIARPRLDAYLAAKPFPASLWSDWEDLGGTWYNFDWTRDKPRLIAGTDDDLLKEDNYLSYLRTESRHPIHAKRIEYDNTSNIFLAAELTASENINEIVFFLAIARGVTKFMSDDDRGFAIVHDSLWWKGNLAAISLMPSQSHFLNQDAYVDQYEAAIRDGVAVIDRLIRDAAARDGEPFPDDPASVREEYERKLLRGEIESFRPSTRAK